MFGPAQTFLRITHTGFLSNGQPNTSPILLPDLDVGYEYAHRKSAVYIPVGGYIDVPLGSRVMFSAAQGPIRMLAERGMAEVSYLFICRNTVDLGGAGGSGISLAPAIQNAQRIAGVFTLVINSGTDTNGYLVGERVTISGLGGGFVALNGTHTISGFAKGADLAGPNPLCATVSFASVGADIPAAILVGVTLVLPDGVTTHIFGSRGNVGGLGSGVRTYLAGDLVVTGTVDPTNACTRCGKGIYAEAGSICELAGNNCYQNASNYTILNGYALPASNLTVPGSAAPPDATIMGGAARPASPALYQCFFDTALGAPRPIWWTGAAWVDATGAGV